MLAKNYERPEEEIHQDDQHYVPKLSSKNFKDSLFIFAQIRADFYGGVIRTKFVSWCLFVRMSYFLNIYF